MTCGRYVSGESETCPFSVFSGPVGLLLGSLLAQPALAEYVKRMIKHSTIDFFKIITLLLDANDIKLFRNNVYMPLIFFAEIHMSAQSQSVNPA